jgi:hypothetical protein
LSSRRALAWCASWAAASASLTGCGPKYVAAPDSPMLVLEAKGRLRVAMQDGDRMVDVGWIDASDIEGQTLVQFDWTEP